MRLSSSMTNILAKVRESVGLSVISGRWQVLFFPLLAFLLGVGGRSLPLLMHGQEVPVAYHDDLDGAAAYQKVLAKGGKLFAPGSEPVPQIGGGYLPRAAFGSEFHLEQWLYCLLQPFTAYSLNIFLIHLAAFFGTFLLMSDYFFQGAWQKTSRLVLVCLISVSYALLPFWGHAGIGVAGLPLVSWALLNIARGVRKLPSWAIACFFPFYSSLVTVNAFYLSIVLLFTFQSARKDPAEAKRLFSAFLLICMLCLIAEYRLLSGIINPVFVSHRTEFSRNDLAFIHAWRKFVDILQHGHYHAHSKHLIVLYFAPPFLLVLLLKKARCRGLAAALAFSLIVSAWYGLWYWEGFGGLKDRFSILNMVDLSRYHWLLPFSWLVTLAFGVKSLSENFRYGFIAALFVLGAHISYIVVDSELPRTYSGEGVTYRDFYEPQLFKEIKHFIGKRLDSFKTLAIGMHPAILSYNGFHTLDFYSSNYPLEYKHLFYRLIKEELAKNAEMEEYFLKWGSRAYAFSSERRKKFLAGRKASISEYLLDKELFLSMGGRYVISAVRIHHFPGFTLKRTFWHPEGIWKLHLYAADMPGKDGKRKMER